LKEEEENKGTATRCRRVRLYRKDRSNSKDIPGLEREEEKRKKEKKEKAFGVSAMFSWKTLPEQL